MFIVHTRSKCVYCVRVRAALSQHGHEYKEVDYTEELEQNREKVIYKLRQLTGRDKITFPLVFHDDKFIGGCDDTIQYLYSILNMEHEF
jgi:glutaredoxin